MTEQELTVTAARWRQRIELEREIRGLRLSRIMSPAPLGRFARQVEWAGSWADLQGVRALVPCAGSMIDNGTLGTWQGKELKASKSSHNGSIGPEAV
jgi:hypothetical protein